MENPSVNFLSQQFDIYYSNAKRCHNEGKLDIAKRNYLLSAKTLMQLAKVSSDRLAKARFERAKRLIEIADNLESVSIDEKDNFKRTSQKSKQIDEEAKSWQGASIPDVHFSDIAGLEDVKEAITIRMIYPLKHPEVYSAYKKQSGGGVLLYGPPGTGKTMIAKAIACEVGATFYAVKGSDIVSKWVGESEKNISSLFETAKNDKLAIIFIDEVDTLLGKRGVDSHNDKRVNEFLQQIDGFSGQNGNLLVLGATNRPWDIDNAAMRSGRFSEKIYVPLPDKEARRFLFNKYTKGLPLASDVDIDELVTLTNGMSGADINEICDEAKIRPLKETLEAKSRSENATISPICRNDFYKVIKKIKPSTTKQDLLKYETFFGGKTQRVEEDITEDKDLRKNDKTQTEIIFKSKVINIYPKEPAKIEFYLEKECKNVYAKILSHNYVCEQNIKNWSFEVLDITSGEHELEIDADGEKIVIKLKFIEGITDNDMGI